MARQLTLDLALPPALGRDDFLVGEANRLAVAALDDCASWPQGRMLLIGPEGSGKTHLASIWAQERGAIMVAGHHLHPERVASLAAAGQGVVVEDADTIGGDEGAEQALFHLWNLTGQVGSPLLVTARQPPRDWGIRLPDLLSRVSTMAQVTLGPPDEAMLAAVLVKLCADRQLAVPPGLIEWMVTRMDRELGEARRLIDALDASSLSEKRPVTRRRAAELLDNPGALDA